MQKLKNKTMAIVISILFVFSMTTSMTLLTNVSAQPGVSIPTYAFINAAPNPAGVGQTVTIGFWIDIPPPTANGAYGDRWNDLTVLVTKPGGTTQTLGPFTSDDTGGTFTTYTPAAVGTYTFKMSFPGQTLAGNNPAPTGQSNAQEIGTYFEPSTSNVYTLTVQQTPTSSLPQTPLPTNYWTRPIESVNNLWYNISGNWLGLGALSFGNTGMYNESGNYNPYSSAPTTAHILWTKPEAPGGLIGGEFSTSSSAATNFYSTSQYEPKFGPIILNGVLYYTQFPGASTNPTGWVAVNLQTGQTIWTDDSANNGGGSPQQTALTSSGIITTLACGQILDYVSPNQYGALAYLWSTGDPAGVPAAFFTGTLNMFDAMTGTYICSVVGAPFGIFGTGMTLTEDQSGNLIAYYVNSTTGTQIIDGKAVVTPVGGAMLECWNSTQCIEYPTGYIPGVSPVSWEWRPTQDGVYSFGNGIMWAAPVATSLNGNSMALTPLSIPGTINNVDAISDGVIVMTGSTAGMLGQGAGFQSGYQIEAGYSTANGAQLWIYNRTYTPDTRLGAVGAADENYAQVTFATGVVTAYSITTGLKAWQITLTGANGGPVNPYDSIGGYQSVIANGVLYLWGLGGDIWAINYANGAILWYTNTTTLSGAAGANTPYGVWPLWTFMVGSGAGGELFVAEGHEYSPPLFHGSDQLAINMTNGKLVWSSMGFDVTGTAISDGIMTTLNAYDNQIYGYGMGPSKTTVTAPGVGVSTSSPVTITGTVMDVSAGAQQQAVAANFPNGLPCVSDASMTQWMEYVYEQQPMPTNVIGVPVTIAVTDSNGNCHVIGTATTDASGTFGLTWTPNIPGNFTVTATFAGTQAYYGSTAETYFYASAPSATPAPTAAPVTGLATASDLTIGIAAAVIAMIIAIAIVGLLLLRKKP